MNSMLLRGRDGEPVEVVMTDEELMRLAAEIDEHFRNPGQIDMSRCSVCSVYHVHVFCSGCAGKAER
jgi:hypothetical protein